MNRPNLTLSQFVLRRNGAPLGAKGSLSNMLHRALGAPTFAIFWQYWNPIFGYYLTKYAYRPLMRAGAPASAAVIGTFLVSGAVHDVAGTLAKGELIVVCTPWFGLMGVCVLAAKTLRINTQRFGWWVRAAANLAYVLGTLTATLTLRALWAG